MADFQRIIDDVKQARDEARLKIHLASKDLQDEWHELEKRLTNFETKAQIDRSAKDVGAALSILGSELKTAYQRLSKAL